MLEDEGSGAPAATSHPRVLRSLPGRCLLGLFGGPFRSQDLFRCKRAVGFSTPTRSSDELLISGDAEAGGALTLSAREGDTTARIPRQPRIPDDIPVFLVPPLLEVVQASLEWLLLPSRPPD